MTRVHLLVNPAAGAGTAGLQADDVANILREEGLSVNSVTTQSPEHAVECAAAADADDIVAPLGGDGMLALAARGLLETGATMLPLPAGRGNDFVRSLGLPLDTAEVARSLAPATRDPERYIKHIDVGVANGVPFLGVLSVGFDAETNERANSFTRMRGPLVYTAAGVATILRLRRHPYVITTPESTHRVEAWNVAVGNSGRHGGGQRVCPDASLSDGLLDVVTFGGPRPLFAAAAAGMRSGLHTRLPAVESFRAASLRIEVDDSARETGFAASQLSPDETSHEMPRPDSRAGHGLRQTAPVAYADGDAIAELPVAVELRPAALRVVVPS